MLTMLSAEARKSYLEPNVAVMNATLGALGSGSQWVWVPQGVDTAAFHASFLRDPSLTKAFSMSI
jgi:hypothetical protein